MKKMIAIVNQPYGTKHISAGDIFNVRDEHVVLLKALGRVRDMPVVKAMSAENTPELIPTFKRESESKSFVERFVDETPFVAESVNIPPVEESSDENTSKTEAVETNQTQAVEIDSTENPEREPLQSEVEQSIEYSRMLRERATALGIHVDGRWSDSRVQREIDEYNKRTYQHMAMQATE